MTTQTDANPEGLAGTGQAPTPPGQDSGEDKSKTFDAAYVHSLRAEAAAFRKELQALKDAEAKRLADAKANEEAELAARQEWQQLAERQKGELTQAQAEAKAKGEALERYQATLGKLLEERRKAVPRHVLALLDKLDPVDQLAYIAENEAEFTKPQPGAGFALPKRSNTPASAPSGRPITL